MIIFLSILCLLLLFGCAFFAYKAYSLGMLVLELEEQVETSLDRIDELFRRISSLLEIPVVYDDPTVRQVIDIMKDTKMTLLLIANKIVSFAEGSNEEKEDKEEN